MEDAQEKQLLDNYVKARRRAEAEKEVLKSAEADLDEAERQLFELMEARGTRKTAEYAGIGYLSIEKPRVYASCKEENREAMFNFLRVLDRGDLIKEGVNPQSLSSFTKELLEAGREVPNCISFYLKPSLKFYARG